MRGDNQLEGRPEAKHANLAKTAEERRDEQLRDEITRLKSALATKTLENDFFKLALLKNQGATSAERRDWREDVRKIVEI